MSKNTSNNQKVTMALPLSKTSICQVSQHRTKFLMETSDAVTVAPTTTCEAVLEIMKKGGFDQVPIVDEHKKMVGLVTTGGLLSHISKGRCKFSDPVSQGRCSTSIETNE